MMTILSFAIENYELIGNFDNFELKLEKIGEIFTSGMVVATESLPCNCPASALVSQIVGMSSCN
mgnify:CR=1 FL=1